MVIFSSSQWVYTKSFKKDNNHNEGYTHLFFYSFLTTQYFMAIPPAAKKIPLVGGRLCLDFVNTANWPNAFSTIPLTQYESADEWFTHPEKIVHWGHQVGLIDEVSVRILIGEIRTTPRAAASLVPTVHTLRLSVRKLLTTPKLVYPLDLEVLNRSLKQAGATSLTLSSTNEEAQYTFSHGRLNFSWLEAAIAYSTAELLTSPLRKRIKICPGDRCGWLFLDNSPNNRRRWCSMTTCGNRHKAKAHYKRKKAE